MSESKPPGGLGLCCLPRLTFSGKERSTHESPCLKGVENMIKGDGHPPTLGLNMLAASQ